MLKKNKIDINKYFKEMCDDSIVFSKKILKSVKVEFSKLEKKKKINVSIAYALFFVLIFAIIMLLNALFNYDSYKSDCMCSNYNNYSYIIDYSNEKDFEKDLNDGKKVNGKVVKFLVNDYKPNSALGINTWSGEHLNFISNYDVDVKKGDFVIGRVIEEPSKVLGSWSIKYLVLRVEKNCVIENEKNNNESSKLPDSNTPNIVPTLSDDKKDFDKNEDTQETPIAKPDTSTPVVKPDDTIKDPIKEEVKYNFYTTNSNEVARDGNKGIFSYVNNGASYDIYWIIDFDGGYVYNFNEGNGDDYCYKIKIKSGNLNNGVTLSYKNKDNAWAKYIHFKYANQPHQLVIVDNDNFTFEYETVSLKSALELRDKKTMYLE